MKVWIKYLIGIVLGLVSYFVLPMDNQTVVSVVAYMSGFFINSVRYIVVPLLFFTGAVSINKLRTSKLLLKTSLWTLAIIVLSALILTIVGLVSILLVKLPRIPITVDTVDTVYSLHVTDLIKSLFPTSAFVTLHEGNFLLVSGIFAALIGWEMSKDQQAMRPSFALFDSLSKLFYGIAAFLTEILSIGLIAIVCNWTITFRAVLTSGIFNGMMLMFLIDFVIIAGIIYPLILYYVCNDSHPHHVQKQRKVGM